MKKLQNVLLRKINEFNQKNLFFVIHDSKNKYQYFHHNYNCGFPHGRRTERTVELALADFWLDQVIDAWEIGAVTPYYWPGRVREVIDPSDKHPRVTQHASLFDVDFTGQDVLSISTIEHIGENSYGLNEEFDPILALKKITSECTSMLITFPLGWNKDLDNFALSSDIEKLCNIRFLVRNSNETWSPALKSSAYRKYGGNDISWANSIAILEKGNVL